MNRRIWICLLLLVTLGLTAVGRTVVEWTFDKPGDLQDWRPNEHLKEVFATNGVLRFRAGARDPILQLQAPLEFKTSPRQLVEIRLKADADGMAQLFWSNTSTGLYGGFTAEKTTDFRVCGDGKWRVYRLLPGWHTEGKIVRLRFDVYDAARYELDYLKIVELDTPAPVADAEFDFTKAGHGWQWLETGTAREPVAWNGGKLPHAATGLLLSPSLQLDVGRQTLATVRMNVNRGSCGTLYFITEAQAGVHRITFPITADGKDRTYHFDLLANTNWSGRILALGLQPSDAANVTVNLRSLKIGDPSQTAPKLAVKFFDCEDALPRAGVPSKILAVIRNSGGRAATNVAIKLLLPAGVKLVENQEQAPPTRQRLGVRQSSAALECVPTLESGRGLPHSKTSRPIAACVEGNTTEQHCSRIGLGEEARFEWTVQAARPTNAKFRLTLAVANAEKLTETKTVHFTARQVEGKLDYVPEPKPVRGPFEVGAYYFPGWPTADRWSYIQNFPERRPVLGWYREGDPEVADWQIKWAVEHGITFFAYDWYWTQGKTHLEHGIHDAYFKARYRHLLKFCLLWANHNPPGTSSHDDCIAVTRYWIENYFRRPEHLTFDGKPVVIIYLPERFTDDMGRDKVKPALDAMREECRRAGLKGLYLTACVSDAGVARVAAEQGYDAITAYTWPFSGMSGEGMSAPYETLVPAYLRKWENLLAESPIPQMPLLVCGGWESRPWHGDHGLVRYGRTPELFKRHLLDGKRFLEVTSVKNLPLSRPLATLSPARSGGEGRERGNAESKMILVEAWNEWGEGSYIEPHQQFGFGYLDAIRDVFTDAPKVHSETTPADVGRGPYDVAPIPKKTAWEFDVADEGWTDGTLVSKLICTNGSLVAEAQGSAQAFFSPPMQSRAGDIRAVVLRLKLTGSDGTPFTDTASCGWRTSILPMRETSGVEFQIQADGQWREYRIPVSQNRYWHGMITRLRFSPCRRPNVRMELDSVRLAE